MFSYVDFVIHFGDYKKVRLNRNIETFKKVRLNVLKVLFKFILMIRSYEVSFIVLQIK